ncbi:helix-turn-helix transcriptional regulator [Desulfocastanea catecholica]
MNKNEQLYTPDELAAKLKVTENALGIWRHNGTGPKYIRISRRAIRYADGAVQEWLKEQEVA